MHNKRITGFSLISKPKLVSRCFYCTVDSHLDLPFFCDLSGLHVLPLVLFYLAFCIYGKNVEQKFLCDLPWNATHSDCSARRGKTKTVVITCLTDIHARDDLAERIDKCGLSLRSCLSGGGFALRLNKEVTRISIVAHLHIYTLFTGFFFNAIAAPAIAEKPLTNSTPNFPFT